MSNVFSSISELAEEFRSGKLKSLQLFEEHLAYIKKYNPQLNALIQVDETGARQLAIAADACIGKRSNRQLNGIFFSAKHSINVSGLSCGDGSESYRDYFAGSDASVIELLKKAGAICIGKGNMAEYGKSFVTDNTVYGKTKNPFNAAFTAGGSGGGDAAAVAAGFASFGIGADAGGSLRVPANACGLFGLCPTAGLITEANLQFPAAGVTQLVRRIGPIAKTTTDLRTILQVLSGFDSRYPYSASGSGPASGKMAFCYFSSMNGIAADGSIQAELERATETFRRCGLSGRELVPVEFESAVYPYIILAGQGGLMAEDLLALEKGPARDFSKEISTMAELRSRIAAELPPLAADRALVCWHELDLLRAKIALLFEQYDFILAPVSASRTPALDSVQYLSDGTLLKTEEAFQFAFAVNALGLPAIAFPTGVDNEGVPLGMQIIGPRFSEWRLIEILEQAGFCEGRQFNGTI